MSNPIPHQIKYGGKLNSKATKFEETKIFPCIAKYWVNYGKKIDIR
jgi:hypothetical protein